MTQLLSVIIPAFNEEERIALTLTKIYDYLNGLNYNFELIVVDDGSTDSTVSLVESNFPKVQIIKQQQNMGKGAAVRRGMMEAKGTLRLFTDADLSTPIYELKKFIPVIENGFDIAIGNRALQSELIKEHQPFYREMMGKTFNKIVQLLVVRGISDTQCGFKLFTEKAAMDIFSKAEINGFSFDVEAVYLAGKMGYKIKEIPVEWYNDDRSKVHPIKDSLKMLIEIMRIRNLHKS